MYRFPDNERRGHNPPPRSCRPIGGTPSLFRSAAPAPRPPLPASPRPIAHRMYGPQMLPQAATHHQPPAPHTPQPEYQPPAALLPAKSSVPFSKSLALFSSSFLPFPLHTFDMPTTSRTGRLPHSHPEKSLFSLIYGTIQSFDQSPPAYVIHGFP